MKKKNYKALADYVVLALRIALLIADLLRRLPL